MSLQDTFSAFETALNTRLGRGIHTTEDSVRLTFFIVAVRELSLLPEAICLECPHPHTDFQNAEVDAVVTDSVKSIIAIEFKFDREIPSGRNSPRPQKAGKIFNDIRRLALLDSGTCSQRLFVYVSDTEMATYLSNERNGLHELFNLKAGHSINIDKEFIMSKCDTFCLNAGWKSEVATIECLYASSLKNGHQLRVWEVRTI